MLRLGGLPRPFIVNVVTDRTPEAAVATMRLAGLEGAHAHELNLALLPPESIASVTESVAQPVYTSCRRRAFMRVYGIDPAGLPDWSDEERMARQLDALQAGSRAIDMELDAFAPNPAELTEEPRAVARQAEIVAAAHALGGEVILSCHTGRVLTAEAIVAIARTARDRGADLIKIVTPCRRRRDLYAVFDAIATIAASVSIPFIVVGAGAAGLPSRTLGANAGASYALGQLTLTPGGFHDQPLVAHLRELRRLLPWPMESEL